MAERINVTNRGLLDCAASRASLTTVQKAKEPDLKGYRLKEGMRCEDGIMGVNFTYTEID
jgi:hypothetical protein